MFRVFYFMSLSVLTPWVGTQEGEKVHQTYIFGAKSHYKENRNIYISDSPDSRKSGKQNSDSRYVPPSGSIGKGKIMEIKDPSRVKELNFTRPGQIKISAFPPEAQAFGLTELRKHDKPIKDVFRFYWSLCKKYCDANGVVPNHREVFRNLKQEGFEVESAGLDTTRPCILEPLATVARKQLKSDEVKKRELPPEDVASVDKNIQRNRQIRDSAKDYNLQACLDSIKSMMEFNREKCAR